MNVAGIHIGRLAPVELDRVLERARTADVTYDDVGSTLRASPDVTEVHRDIGTGTATFERARDGLRSWATHDGIPAFIHPAEQPVSLGATVIVVLHLGPFTVFAPDRIVAVIDEPTRFAYAYGTLPGHPERGEESFAVELLDSGVVRATIRVRGEPATSAARLVGPVVRRLQRIAVRRYLDALADYVVTPARTA